jgi:hypothetical protein
MSTDPAIVIEFVGRCLRRRNQVSDVSLSRHRAQQGAAYLQRGGSWLEGTAAAPPKVAASAELQAQLKLQDEAAQALKKLRYEHGALNIDTSRSACR